MEKLNDKWVAWYHYDINVWTVDSFRKLVKLETVEDFWYFVDALKTLNNILIEHVYFIRDGIMPMWEDKRNRNGGCWSLKIDIKDCYTIFVKILMFLVCEKSLINGEKKY